MKTLQQVLTPKRAKVILPASAGVAALLAYAILPSDGAAQAQSVAQPPPPSVTIETVRPTDFKHETSYSGRVEAIDKIELRTRVSGFITKREFEEGSEVKKGQLLFEIDPRPYKIALSQAEANLASSQAALEDAKAAFDRTQELVARQVSSGATLSTSKLRLAQARAKVDVDKSQVEQAQLNLDFTQVRAPISGRIGRAAHAVGDFVNEGSASLATLISLNDVYVHFAVPRPALARLAKGPEGTFAVEVEIRHNDRDVYPQRGKIAFVDIEANSATNTVIVRAKAPNPNRTLVPQELVDVSIVDKRATETLVVSQSALLIDQLGTYVLTVDEDNKVEQRRFKPGVYRGGFVTVKSGLSAGDRVIVRGHLKAKPGMVVTPEPAKFEVSDAAGGAKP